MIFLIGHGYVGNEIAKMFNRSSVKYVHITHKHFLENDILGLSNKDSIVINAAGYTGTPNVDACEDNKHDCIYGNIIWPLLLEEKCGDKIPVIHIGSGCIYNNAFVYSPTHYYSEQDKPNFTFKENSSFYSGCKAFSEEVLESYLNKSYILRIRMPFSSYSHPRNYLTKLMTYDKLVNVQNSISCLEDVAKVVLFFINKRPEPGVYNCTNPGSVTTFTITEMLKLKPKWFNGYDEFQETVKARRSNCLLNVEKLNKLFKLRTVEDALIDAIERIKL